MRRDWANMRIELLELIAERLVTNFVDLIRFRAVCKSWGSITLKKPTNPTPQLPWLLLSSDDETIATPRCHFFSLSDNRVYSFPLSESLHNCCCRSSSEWLFMVDNDGDCSLLNPLTGVGLLLPSIKSFMRPNAIAKEDRERCIVKVALSSSPNSDANEVCSIMLILHGRLAFCEIGYKNFKRVHHLLRKFEDVIYFKGNFYAVDRLGGIVVCDLGADPAAVTTEIKTIESSKAYKNYLVESSGELLLVRRFIGKKINRTVLFKVFHEDKISKRWVEVESLGGHALFIGYNHSLSLLASEFFGCRRDCIYFTDNCFIDSISGRKEPHDVGVFNLADGRIWVLPGYNLESRFITQPPIWITPSPC